MSSGCLPRRCGGTFCRSSSACSAAFSARGGHPVSRAASASSSAQLSWAAADWGASSARCSSAWRRWASPRSRSYRARSRAARTRSAAGLLASDPMGENNSVRSPEHRPVKSCPIARSSTRAPAAKSQSPAAAPWASVSGRNPERRSHRAARRWSSGSRPGRRSRRWARSISPNNGWSWYHECPRCSTNALSRCSPARMGSASLRRVSALARSGQKRSRTLTRSRRSCVSSGCALRTSASRKSATVLRSASNSFR